MLIFDVCQLSVEPLTKSHTSLGRTNVLRVGFCVVVL
jgi:hypothetical protein